MALRRRHDQLRGFVDRVTLSVPVDDYAINAAAHHIVNLALHLRRSRLTVAHIHMARTAEPQNHMGIELGCSSRIEQRVNVDLAYISRALVIVRLRRKAIGRARVVRGLSGEGCGRNHIVGTGRTQSRRSNQSGCESKLRKTHDSSGAEVEPRTLLRSGTRLGKAPAYEFTQDWLLYRFIRETACSL